MRFLTNFFGRILGVVENFRRGCIFLLFYWIFVNTYLKKISVRVLLFFPTTPLCVDLCNVETKKCFHFFIFCTTFFLMQKNDVWCDEKP